MNGIKFAERIKELRTSKGWTMEELGEKLGKTKSTISTWEKGTRSPKVRDMREIAEVFGVTESYLLGLTENQDTVTVKESNGESIKFSLDSIYVYENFLRQTGKPTATAIVLDTLIEKLDNDNFLKWCEYGEYLLSKQEN